MDSKRFMNAREVAQYMEISEAMAYKIIRHLNEELNGMGYITINGKVSRTFFEERVYGAAKTPVA